MSRSAKVRLGIVILALLFAVQGGEYTTWNWLELCRSEQREAAMVEELKGVVDSLQQAARAIERDPKVQERVARESFGMIKDGEFLFRVVPPSEP